MKCCFCGKDIGKYGTNPWPVYWGNTKRCCDECNLAYVIPVRLAAKSSATKIQETMKEEGC